MHRVPQKIKKHSEAVLMVHGLAGSAAGFAIHPNKSMSLILHDGGFDVWMLNVRGISYSLKHQYEESRNPKFWDFSFHEHGFYDLPRAIDHILHVTGNKKIHYVGHSQGGTNFLAMLSTKPEYNQKISSAYLLAPGMYLPLTPVLSMIETGLEIIKELNIHAIELRNKMLEELVGNYCNEHSELCSALIFMIIGPISDDLNEVLNLLSFNFQKYI